VFKTLELKPWIADPARAALYPSNYLFYPVYGALCRLLDALDVLAGDLRRQIDRALELGYEVLVVRLWTIDPGQLERESGMIADSRQLTALTAMLGRDFAAEHALDDPVMGRFDRLTRSPRP
jgi:hypothetical protein